MTWLDRAAGRMTRDELVTQIVYGLLVLTAALLLVWERSKFPPAVPYLQAAVIISAAAYLISLPLSRRWGLRSVFVPYYIESEPPPEGVSTEWSWDGSDRVLGDEEQLRSAFGKLVRNAYQAMPKGGRLRIHGRRDGHVAEVQLTDSGEGIPEEALVRVFEPLYTSRTFDLGLGLTTARAIVERHGGSIAVRSRPGEGTSVTVRLPAGAETPGAPPQPSPAGTPAGAEG